MRTIRDYLGIGRRASLFPSAYIPEQTHGLAELKSGKVFGVQLDDTFEVPDSRLTNPSNIEFRLYSKAGVGVAVDMISDTPVGFISGNLAVSIRSGLGVGSHLAAYFDGQYLPYPRSYSVSGFRNRLAAHALLVTWAMLDGEKVPQEIRNEYHCVNDRLESREKLKELGTMLNNFQPPEHILRVYRS
jgi:hypothetical protein